jgi:hypothetical protein
LYVIPAEVDQDGVESHDSTPFQLVANHQSLVQRGLPAAALRDRQLVEQGQGFILDDLASPGHVFGQF